MTVSPQARVDAYLDEVGARLLGPRRRRTAILAELRDGLDHTIADRHALGQGSADATRAAISEFGEPRAVAVAFTAELATAYARRTIALYLATGPFVGAWWLLLVRPAPWRVGLVALLAALPVLPLIALAVLAGASTLATTGRLMRWLPETSPSRALFVTVAIASLATVSDLTLIISVSGGHVRPLTLLAIGSSLTRITCSAVTLAHARRILHAYR
jgi:hypothetical protein